ncbi:KGK domain-containing protein [Cyanobacterium aponinum UTEX 3221]|uniref:KGK domain-containing protein n=1 Tax=Cyanobacterium aponinum TaxID=379064 RepID=UPI002B4BF4E1|nr:KGK domain-containing protein [Cyanobacterium aponinum]WRL37302.1 KGK domain-containing protein [Cyanobacterium aponinum UTEX 3221]
MTKNREMLNDKDVISLEDQQCNIRLSHKTFTVEEFKTRLKDSSGVNDKSQEWFNNGVNAEVMTGGKPWRKGKVRLSIEFIPDESEIESPLDDFRQKTNL